MGRRYRNKEPLFIEFIEMIAKAHYGFGLAIAVVFFGIAELLIPWWFGRIPEWGERMLIHVVPPFQWLFLGIAGISLLAATYSFWINLNK